MTSHKSPYQQHFDTMTSHTKPYQDHDDTMEAEPSPLVHSPTPYHDSSNEDRPVRNHRALSWGSQDTLEGGICGVRSQLPATFKAPQNTDADLDLKFIAVDASHGHRTRRRRPWLIFIAVASAVLVVALVAFDMVLRLSQSTWTIAFEDEDDDIFRNWGQGGSGTEGLPWYPTNFLQDVIPKPIHSHNDYWRKVPLFTAIHQGCTGVEADVWLVDDTNNLYVGHEQAALQGNRTFQSLYIQPLVEILERANPTTSFYNGSGSYRGVFDTAPDQTLTLLVDVKTAGVGTWAEVVAQLEPLRQRGWLSYYADGTVHSRPITVVGTGNTPFESLTNATYRDYFFDAPLTKLADHSAPYNDQNSYYASVSFGSSIGKVWMGQLSPDQVERIRTQVAQAHNRGLKARYWDLPAWPIQTRNMVWDVLVKESVDMLNVDDVKTAAKRPWGY